MPKKIKHLSDLRGRLPIEPEWLEFFKKHFGKVLPLHIEIPISATESLRWDFDAVPTGLQWEGEQVYTGELRKPIDVCHTQVFVDFALLQLDRPRENKP